jgi:hypothetical protein
MARTPEDRAKRQKLREIEGARAMADYRADQQAERNKTTKLRAARLAREDANPSSPAKSKPKKPHA